MHGNLSATFRVILLACSHSDGQTNLQTEIKHNLVGGGNYFLNSIDRITNSTMTESIAVTAVSYRHHSILFKHCSSCKEAAL